MKKTKSIVGVQVPVKSVIKNGKVPVIPGMKFRADRVTWSLTKFMDSKPDFAVLENGSSKIALGPLNLQESLRSAKWVVYPKDPSRVRKARQPKEEAPTYYGLKLTVPANITKIFTRLLDQIAKGTANPDRLLEFKAKVHDLDIGYDLETLRELERNAIYRSEVKKNADRKFYEKQQTSVDSVEPWVTPDPIKESNARARKAAKSAKLSKSKKSLADLLHVDAPRSTMGFAMEQAFQKVVSR